MPSLGEQEAGEPAFGVAASLGTTRWPSRRGGSRRSGTRTRPALGFRPSADARHPQLVAAIDNRLADIAAEIGALDAAKAQLTAPGAGGAAPAVTEPIATPSRRRTARRGLTPPPQPPEPATGGRATEPVQAARDGASAGTPQRSTRQRAATVTRARPGGGAVRSETLERLLADTSAGLSANAIAQRPAPAMPAPSSCCMNWRRPGRSAGRSAPLDGVAADHRRGADCGACRGARAPAQRPQPAAREGPGPRSAARYDASAVPHELRRLGARLSARVAGSGPSQCRAQTRDLKVAVDLRCVALAAGGTVRSIALASTGAINVDHSVVMCDLS